MVATQSTDPCRLVADVGGTNTRLALFDPRSNALHSVTTYTNREYERFEDIISLWLGSLDRAAPTQCCIAAAAPPSGDQVTMININWSFSCRELAANFGFGRLARINDFEANAYALPHLAETDYTPVHAGQKDATGALAVVGPGTGLGGATLDTIAGSHRARACEPGHMGLAPATDLELELYRLLLVRHGELYAELLVSG